MTAASRGPRSARAPASTMSISTRWSTGRGPSSGAAAIARARSGLPGARPPSAIPGQVLVGPRQPPGRTQLRESLGVVPGTVGGEARGLSDDADARRPGPRGDGVLPGGLGIVVDEPSDHHEVPGDLLRGEGAEARQDHPDVAIEFRTCHVVGEGRRRVCGRAWPTALWAVARPLRAAIGPRAGSPLARGRPAVTWSRTPSWPPLPRARRAAAYAPPPTALRAVGAVTAVGTVTAIGTVTALRAVTAVGTVGAVGTVPTVGAVTTVSGTR